MDIWELIERCDLDEIETDLEAAKALLVYVRVTRILAQMEKQIAVWVQDNGPLTAGPATATRTLGRAVRDWEAAVDNRFKEVEAGSEGEARIHNIIRAHTKTKVSTSWAKVAKEMGIEDAPFKGSPVPKVEFTVNGKKTGSVEVSLSGNELELGPNVDFDPEEQGPGSGYGFDPGDILYIPDDDIPF